MRTRKAWNLLSASTLFISLVIATTLLTYFVFNIYPIVEFLNFVGKNNLNWLLVISLIIPAGLILYDRARYKKFQQEKIVMYRTIIHKVQDNLQKVSALLQIAILDLEEKDDGKEVVTNLQESFNELSSSIKKLSETELEELSETELTKNLSIFINPKRD